MSAAEIAGAAINTTARDGQRVLDALKAAGYAVVELPKPIDSTNVSSEFAHSVTYWKRTTEPRSISLHGADPLATPERARSLAAALLAAAEAAS